ncbi:MAG: universal stress protein [Desulfobacteraceae bacterium]|nr:universal stress protein [Desulfobacteraceae bacterium]
MKIMVCYNGTEPSKQALRTGREYAKRFAAEMIVVMSLEKGGPDNQGEINEAKDALAYAKSLVETEGITCRTDLLIHGMEPGRDLVEFATSNDVDLMAIGIVRKSKVGKLFFGSTAQYVILNAPCPVLSLK